MRCWRCRFWIAPLIVLVLQGLSGAAGFPGDHPSWAGAAAMADGGLRADQLVASSRPLLSDGSASLQQARAAGERAPSTIRALALMVAFSDSSFYVYPAAPEGTLPRSTQSEFLYAAHDSSFYAHLLQNVADYYTAVSGGRFTFEYTLHGQVIELAEAMAFYGNHPTEGEQPLVLARDAVVVADPTVDFTAYDTIIIIHAGAGQETDANNDSPEQIYSTYLGFEDFADAVQDSVLQDPFLATDDHDDGEGIGHVLVVPECEYQDPGPGSSGYYGSLGVYCFELGLRLGMLSLFDFTDNDSQGIGQFGLMGFGLWSAGGLVPPEPCAFNKQFMGWLDPVVVDPAAGATWTVDAATDVAGPRACARIDLSGAEYYLLEYRLQDPDGNNRFSFDAGDLNGDGVPNFFDADSDSLDGTPTGFFDPQTDTAERFLEAEWDFFLSDNAARTGPYKAAGSGLLIWHVDEGVIRNVWDAEGNLFNGDPHRKSVDLEEADGIQDLDRRQGSAYWLGADVDTWKAEGQHRFGPSTRPDTRSNGGADTGLIVDQISAVVADSSHVFEAGTEREYTGIRYHRSMDFRCSLADQPGRPVVLATRDLPGVDLGATHLRAARLTPGASQHAVIATASEGRVYAFNDALGEWVDHDGDPETFAPLCTGTDADGAPVSWLGSAAVGRFVATDPSLDLVLTARGGLYAFRQDGTPVMSGGVPGREVGLIAPLHAATLPAVLLPLTGEGLAAPTVACVATVDPDLDGAPAVLRFLAATGEDARGAVTLPGTVASPPVLAGRLLLVPVVGADASGLLVAVSWPEVGEPALVWTRALDLVPGARPLTVADDVVLISDDQGLVQTVSLIAGEPRLDPRWSADAAIASTVGAGGAVVVAGRFGRVGEGGAWQVGWPLTPLIAMDATSAEPLALGDASDPAGYLFGARDGRLYLTDPDGMVMAGWPVAGPADLLSTPVVLGSDPSAARLSIVAAGVTPRVVGVDPDTDGLIIEPVTRLRSWTQDVPGDLLPSGTGVAQYGASPAGRIALSSLAPVDHVTGSTRLSDTHVCHPQPLRADVLKVRGAVPTDGRARVVIYDLQGEVVRDTGSVPVLGGADFEIEVDLAGAASGLYICKLVAGGQASVKTIAVAR